MNSQWSCIRRPISTLFQYCENWKLNPSCRRLITSNTKAWICSATTAPFKWSRGRHSMWEECASPKNASWRTLNGEYTMFGATSQDWKIFAWTQKSLLLHWKLSTFRGSWFIHACLFCEATIVPYLHAVLRSLIGQRYGSTSTLEFLLLPHTWFFEELKRIQAIWAKDENVYQRLAIE